MKTAKRVLASIIAVIMIVGTCAVAASAATTIQAQIDSGVNPVKLTKNTTESITINKNVTIDLNGYCLTGVDGKAAIKVTGGDVTVTNGQVLAVFGRMSTQQMIETVSNKCPPAIQVTGGSLTVDGVRLVGGQIRVPTTSIDNPTLVPAGSGIMSYNGATVTLKRTSIYGDYGVNNAVRTSTAGGVVTVEDAIILAYNKAIKGAYAVANGSEEIVAADRISAILPGGFNATEEELAYNLLNERTLIVSKTAVKLADELGQKAVVIKRDDMANCKLDIPTLDYTWKNEGGEGVIATDCSYKLVPEAILMADGTYADLPGNIAKDLVADGSYEDINPKNILYRVEYLMGVESKPYITSLTKEGLENPLDGVIPWAANYINESYGFAVKPTNDGKINSYDEVVAELGKLMKTVDDAGNFQFVDGADWRLADVQLYQDIRKALYDLAGRTGFKAKGTGYDMTVNAYNTIYGTTVTAVPEIVGTLDRIAALKDQLEATLGDDLFLNTAAYGDVFVWAVETAYPELMITEGAKVCIFDELADRLNALSNLLGQKATIEVEVPGEGGTTTTQQVEVDVAKEMGGDIGKYIELIDTYAGMINEYKGYIETAFASEDVQFVIDYVEENSANLAAEITRVIDIIDNYRTYINPAKYIDGDFVKTYCTYGPIEIKELDGTGNLTVDILGSGTVYYPDPDIPSKTKSIDSSDVIEFRDTITLTAVADAGSEFLFWANREGGDEGNYILSTEPTFTWNTSIDRYVEAVFNGIDTPVVYFTNPSGGICGNSDVAGGKAAIPDAKPAIAGYGFHGWPNATGTEINVTAAGTAYAAGNSAFAAAGVSYGEDGALLFVRPNSASYIATAKYSRTDGTYTVNFIDGNGTHPLSGKLYDVATWTAEGYTNCYWVDENNNLVSPTNTMHYNIVENGRTFTAVEGTSDETFATTTTIQLVDGKYIIYIGLNTTKAVKNYGMVFTFDSATVPEVGNTGNQVSQNSYNPNTLFSASCNKYWVDNNGGTIYIRPYVEFTDGTILYGDMAHN